jgi:hypothetical protein
MEEVPTKTGMENGICLDKIIYFSFLIAIN